MQYLRNAQSDFDPFFSTCLPSAALSHVKTEKMVFTPPPPPTLALRPQGGLRVKNEVGLFLKILWSKAGCKKPHQKTLFLKEVMNFFKSGSQYNYYTRANFKSRYLKTTLRTVFEKTISLG